MIFDSALLRRYVGWRWNASSGGTRHWWLSPRLTAYIDAQIDPATGGGVSGALAAFPDRPELARGVSIGCGTGAKERRLLAAGLVGHFDLFELSETKAAAARRGAAEAGLPDRVTVRTENAFARPAVAAYDLVYWDHALHHMLDVDAAIRWSLAALRPGGLLVVNDYVGPTRLVWRRAEIDAARAFLAAHRERLGIDPATLRYRHGVDRLRMTLRDPSEAAQSDRILPCFADHTGSALRPIGGVLVHLLAPLLAAVEDESDPIYAALCEADRQALAGGLTHFAFGIWQRPG